MGCTLVCRYPQGLDTSDILELEFQTVLSCPSQGLRTQIFYRSCIFSQLLSHILKLASFTLHQVQRANGPCMRMCLFIPAFDA